MPSNLQLHSRRLLYIKTPKWYQVLNQEDTKLPKTDQVPPVRERTERTDIITRVIEIQCTPSSP